MKHINGKQVFEALSRMSEEQMEECHDSWNVYIQQVINKIITHIVDEVVDEVKRK